MYIAEAYPDQAATFAEHAAELGFCEREAHRMWAWLAKICMVTGVAPDLLTPDAYLDARTRVQDAVATLRGWSPCRAVTRLIFRTCSETSAPVVDR